MRDLLEAKEKVQDDSLSLSIIRKDVDETLFASLSKQFGLNLLPSNRPSITQRACPVLLFVNKQI